MTRRLAGTVATEDALPALLRHDFGLFLRFAFAEIGGERPYQHNWHIDAVIHKLDCIRTGKSRRLIVNVPPRHLKSVAITIAWVAWMLGNDPSRRFMCISYGLDLAEEHALSCLRMIESDWYKRAFPRLKLIRKAALNFKTSMGGGRLSTSLAGASTGFGADHIILDDPMKAADATSENARESVKNTFYDALRSRLEDQERGSIILVAQRLHDDDLSGALLRTGNWDHLKLSAIATHDQRIPLTRNRFHMRRTGHALHPARLSLAELLLMRAEAPFVFESQWQNDPVPRVGSFVQPEWFGSYEDPPTGGIVVMSVDTAVKKTVRNDWSVLIVARYYQRRFYILDVLRKRMTFFELEKAVVDMCALHKVTRLLIEDASSGQSLIQNLREMKAAALPLPIPVRATIDKTTRFEAQSTKIEAGSVVLPQAAPWKAEFMSELTKFPNGRHDDQVDALAHLLANPPREIVRNTGPELVEAGSTLNYRQPDIDPWAGT